MKTTVRYGFLAALAVAAAACGSSDLGLSASAGTGHVSISLTDAPGDVQAAVVTIAEVYLQGETESEDDRAVLTQQPVTVDLVDLQNDLRSLVDAATVDAGSYSQLRLVVTGGYVAVEEDGETHIYASSADYEGLPAGAVVTGELQLPSLAQSGLKIDLPDGGLDLAADEDVDLLADFHVSESFGQAAGSSGMWVMEPVIRVLPMSAAAQLVVGVTLADGVILPTIGDEAIALGSFKVRLTDAAGASEELQLGTDGAGVTTAAFMYIDPARGPFTVALVGPAGVTVTVDPATPAPIDLTTGQNTLTLTVTAAAAI